jgi:hypothetical protein
MTKTTLEPCLVFLDAHGIYIPQLWCSDLDQEQSEAIGASWKDVQTCQAGPDQEWYWEAWASILDNVSMTDDNGTTWKLHQDGDLWEVPDGFVFEN